MSRQSAWTGELMQYTNSAMYTSHKGNIARKALLKEQAGFKAWQRTPSAGNLTKQVDVPAVYALFGPLDGLVEGLLGYCLQDTPLQLL